MMRVTLEVGKEQFSNSAITCYRTDAILSCNSPILEIDVPRNEVIKRNTSKIQLSSVFKDER